MSVEVTVDVVLRVLGDFDLDRLLRENTDIELDSVWRRGDLPSRPRQCGFNKLLFGDVAPRDVARELALALNRYRQVIQQLPSGSAQIDIGVLGVDSACSVVLDGHAVSLVAEMGLGLSFVYYPSAD